MRARCRSHLRVPTCQPTNKAPVSCLRKAPESGHADGLRAATLAPAADRLESGWDGAAPRSVLVRLDWEPLADRREEPADPTACLCAKIL
jgi:hypothetical protein